MARPAPLTPVIVDPAAAGPPLPAEAEQALAQMAQAAVGEFFQQHKN